MLSRWRSRAGVVVGVAVLGSAQHASVALAGESPFEASQILGVLPAETSRPMAVTVSDLRAVLARRHESAAFQARLPSAASLEPPTTASLELPSTPQVVFLDFDGGAPTFDVVQVDVDGNTRVLRALPSHVYTPEERARIESLIGADVAPFGIAVTRTAPSVGAFSTLTFNGALPIRLVAAPGRGFFVDGSFGDSEHIDHRNGNRADNAVIAAHLWEFFVFTDPSGQSLARASGLAVDAEHTVAERLSEAVVQQSANTAAHELGHLLGLRHHDGFGPLGSGLPDTGVPDPLAFVPVFDGPRAATETLLDLMSTGGTGATPRVRASVDQSFSKRASLKLTLALGLAPLTEVEAASAVQEPRALRAPDVARRESGEAGAEFDARVLLVDARISTLGEVDEFRFHGIAHEVWTVDLVSTADPSFVEPVMTDLRLFLEHPDGSRELLAYNAQTFEPDDPLLLDVELPSDGTYVVQVDAPDTAYVDADADGFADDPISLEDNGLGELRTGDYELFLYGVDLPLAR